MTSVRFELWKSSRISSLSILVAVSGLVLGACGGSGSTATTTSLPPTTEAPEVNVVHVALTENGKVQGVDSDLTTFKAGVSYHFVVENVGTRSHELMIIQPIEPGSMDMEAMDEMSLHVVEEDDLRPGATAEFDYTFPDDAVGTALEFACYLEGHYEAGMHEVITVEG